MEKLWYHATPLGDVTLVDADGKLAALLRGRAPAGAGGVVEQTALHRLAAAQLDEYFAGKRHGFDIPLCLRGTDFQREVWRRLQKIPYGATMSYRELAEAVGAPRGYRAVGMANNKNPAPIVVPCHRVVGADGGLVGYGFGGVENKRFLLELEGAL